MLQQLDAIYKREQLQMAKFAASQVVGCGEIQFSDSSSQLFFCCNFCGKQYRSLRGFVQHALAQHLLVEAEKIEALTESALLDEEDDNEVAADIFDKLDQAFNMEYANFELEDDANAEQYEAPGGNSIKQLKHLMPMPKQSKKQRKATMPATQHRFSCMECGKLCIRNAVQVTHCAKHSTLRPFGCDVCDATFAKKQNLQVHYQRHLGDKPFLCTTCGKSYYALNELKRHERYHTSVTRYNCEICNKGFHRKCLLSSHQRRHQNDRPHKCETCGRCFFEKSALRNHARTHTNERPYACTICSKQFRLRKTLRQHMKIHSNHKSYSCDDCGQLFAQNAGLFLHKRRCHKEKD